MAKTKGKGIKTSGDSVEYTPTLYIDLEDPEDVEGLQVGQKVQVLVTGTIETIRIERDRSSLTLVSFECEVESKGVFERLSEDD